MSATYVLGRRCANSASRVADSKRIGSTPVARGSRVPAWPTRWAPVSRRSDLTTWNDVWPDALSTFNTPLGNDLPSALGRGGTDRLLGRRQHLPHRLVHRPLDLRSRGADVPAPAKARAHRGGVDGAAAADADLGQGGR